MEDIGRRNWALIWVIGMTGQICWNIENSWNGTAGMIPSPVLFLVSAVLAVFTVLPLIPASKCMKKRLTTK